jgi:hypothetical protein
MFKNIEYLFILKHIIVFIACAIFIIGFFSMLILLLVFKNLFIMEYNKMKAIYIKLEHNKIKNIFIEIEKE